MMMQDEEMMWLDPTRYKGLEYLVDTFLLKVWTSIFEGLEQVSFLSQLIDGHGRFSGGKAYLELFLSLIAEVEFENAFAVGGRDTNDSVS